MVKWSSGQVKAAVLTSVFCLLTSAFAVGSWRGVYHDGPIAVALKPSRAAYSVGDTFKLTVTATNTSDRTVLVRRDWREQLVLYHIHPTTGEQIEWPGYLCTATWLDSGDVVRLKPGGKHSNTKFVRVFTPDDVSTFDFRVKLGGVKDYGRRFDTWQGVAWSNPIKVTVKPKK